VHDGGTRPYAAIGLTLLLWASSFPAIKAGLTAYSPLHLAALRFLVASVALASLARLLHIRVPERKDLPLFLALAAFGVASYHVAVNCGASRLSASATAFIANVAPIFTIAMGGFALGERIAPRGWLGCGLGLLGAWLIAYAEGGTVDVQIGSLMVLLAAVCWSLFFVLQKPLLRSYSPIEVTCYSVWFGTALLCVLLRGALGAIESASRAATLAVLYLGVFPTAVAYWSWSYVLARVPASRAAIYTYLVPVLSAGMASVWLGNRPTLAFDVGAALALAGVMMATTGQGARVGL
jgi:drug/metabolite transporter (DMT)-like permease